MGPFPHPIHKADSQILAAGSTHPFLVREAKRPRAGSRQHECLGCGRVAVEPAVDSEAV